jgi:hypothetical protein
MFWITKVTIVMDVPRIAIQIIIPSGPLPRMMWIIESGDLELAAAASSAMAGVAESSARRSGRKRSFIQEWLAPLGEGGFALMGFFGSGI